MPKAAEALEQLARHLNLEDVRRTCNGPEPTWVEVEVAWAQTRNRWIYIARDALAWTAQHTGDACES
jgi:hypothetical protein